jgi:hypothetical protein
VRPAVVPIVAVASVAAIVACGSKPADDWTGGPATPPTVAVTTNPNALPLGSAILSGIVVGDQQMILYFWGDHHHPTPGAA